MKGYMSDIYWTMILAIFAIVIAFFVFIFSVFQSFGGNEITSYSLRFIHEVSKPYKFADILIYMQIDDRTLLEQLTESIYAGSFENINSNKTDVVATLSGFFDKYGIKYKIFLNLTNDSLQVGRIATLCGDNLEGFCVSRLNYALQGLQYCGVGRREIDGGINPCPNDKKCCVEDPSQTKVYARGMEYDIVRCGPSDEGVCSPKVIRYFGFGNPDYCGEGRILIDDNGKCSTETNGIMPICCKPMTKTDIIKSGIGNAQVPLLYKNKLGFLEIMTEG